MIDVKPHILEVKRVKAREGQVDDFDILLHGTQTEELGPYLTEFAIAPAFGVHFPENAPGIPDPDRTRNLEEAAGSDPGDRRGKVRTQRQQIVVTVEKLYGSVFNALVTPAV
jgi:hypothetical protein